MRLSYLIVLMFTVVGCGSYFYYSYMPVCLVPITYRLGDLDVRFNITNEEAKDYLADAEAVWENAAGEELFVYDENSDFSVNFIFDDRQERTIAEEAQRASLDSKEVTSAEVGAQYKKLTKEYATLKDQYDTRVADYEGRLATFNTKVANYNQTGGAPEGEFARLKIEERKLGIEAAALGKRADTLASLAAEINTVSEQGNRLIQQYNAGVADYNHEFAAPNEFTQGDYQGESINIYKFATPNELRRVLTHEFGHALGVGHVEGEVSIMYYLMEKQPDLPVLSSADQAALMSACSDQSRLTNWFYRLVRSMTVVIQ